MIIVICLSSYHTYRAFYPEYALFISEFRDITKREFPSSGVIEDKAASYPDLHGDYCSSSVVSVSNEQWRSLKEQINQDQKFESGQPIGGKEFDKVIGKQSDFIGYVRKDLKYDQDKYIGFIEQGNKLLLNRCSY